MIQKKENALMSKTLLIIEDDVVSRDLLRLVFEYDGFQCMEAENGAIGLTMLESQAFDVIILDNVMPVMTGLAFLEHWQRQPQKSDVPIIMITGLLSPEVRENATKLGAYTIVGKPYDLSELRALVSQLCVTAHSLPQESSLLPK
jgi:two-component system phosphate regulon response regulator PhoB